MATDIRIAAEHATFGLTEVARAIIPAGGGLTLLEGKSVMPHYELEKVDVTDLLPRVQSPTLVLHRRGYRQYGVDIARRCSGR